jgi:cardiolipin synthase
VQDAGGHLSAQHSENLLEHAAGDAASAAHLHQFVDAEQHLSGRPLVAGNRVTLLIDGPATYQAMFDAMRVATDHIHLEVYELADDQIGQPLADLVLERRAAGVHVKILYDSLGSRGSSAAYFERLRTGGALVHEFHPVNPTKDLRVWRVLARDHRKLLIVDGKVAFTGGINFSRVYARGSSASTAKAQDTVRGWRDTTVRIEGPAVAEFQQLFLQNWTQGEPQQVWTENNFPLLSNVGPTLVRVVASASGGQDYTIYKASLAALGLAQQRIWVTQAYFTPTDAFMEALQAAAHRGVDVRILLPGVSDHPSVVYAAHAHYTALLKAGGEALRAG